MLAPKGEIVWERHPKPSLRALESARTLTKEHSVACYARRGSDTKPTDARRWMPSVLAAPRASS